MLPVDCFHAIQGGVCCCAGSDDLCFGIEVSQVNVIAVVPDFGTQFISSHDRRLQVD